MLKCLACRCHNSEPIIRRVLRISHHQGWAIEPIIRGKAECLSYLENFEENHTIGALKKYIEQNSSWAVILGFDGNRIDWAEVGHGGSKARLDGQIIVERYGDVVTKDK